jgi:hypothetical protein
MAYAQSSAQDERGFGVAINSAFNGQVLPFRTIATGHYYQGINQIELGLGIHPFIRKEQSIVSADMNYKLFPNGRHNKLKLYLLADLSYINTSRETFYPTTYHYLFLHGGYGVELNGFAGTYIDTSVSFGGFTYKKASKNPASSYLDAEQFFKEYGSSINLQVSVGYRF